MTSFIDYANSFETGSEMSEIPFLIKDIMNRSELDSDLKKKHMFHAVLLRSKEDSILLTKSILELYLFDKEGLKNLKYSNKGIPITRSSLTNFRLRDRVAEIKSQLFLRQEGFDFFGIHTYNNLDISDENLLIEETKNFNTELERLNFWSHRVVLRKPEDYSDDQKLDIIVELNNILNPF